MVDNRSAGFYGVGGSFNFKSGDISGTTANLSDDKAGQGNEYYAQQKKQDDSNDKQSDDIFTDRSAHLRATLNSLAMLNVASVLNTRKAPMNKVIQKKETKEQKASKKIFKISKDTPLTRFYISHDEQKNEN